MPKLKNEPIRIETHNTRGWQVRFYYQEDGKTKYHSKLFSDGVFGSKKEALRAALKYRDDNQDVFTRDYRNREIEPYRKRDKRNNSGVPGIMFYEFDGADGSLVHVRGHVPGKDKRLITKTISLNKHGNEAAVKAICRFRYNGLKKLHGKNTPYPSWQRLYNEVVSTVGDKYDLSPVEEPGA
jgi:hypothetical protein